MAGKIIQIAPIRTYDFSFMMNDPLTLDFPLKRGIDTREWLTGTIIVRVISLGGGNMSQGTIAIRTFADGATSEDPGTDFLLQPGHTVSLDTTSLAALPPPCCIASGLDFHLGSSLRVILTATRIDYPGTFAATFGVDLVLKNL